MNKINIKAIRVSASDTSHFT